MKRGVKQGNISCKDCGLKFTHWDVFKTHLHQHALEEEEEEEEEEEQEEEEEEEEEEEAEMGDYMNTAAELDSARVDDGENRGEDTNGDADECDMSSSLQTQPSGLTEDVEDASTKEQLGKIHACKVCGKVYTYLVSFKKHLRLHENPPSSTKSLQSVENLAQYQCPECGISFIRRARLLGHLRVHMSLQSKPPRCDQCNKEFSSIKSWMDHVNVHKQKPFWCLSCAKGFKDEELLDKHLHSHSRRKHVCIICHKSFHLYKQLRIHYNTHPGAKPYQCTFCGKSFSQRGNLITHRKKHFRVYVGSSGMPLGIKKQMIKKKRFILASVKEEPEVDTNMAELPWKEEHVERNKTQRPCEDAECRDSAMSEESDCGEPLHHFKLSKAPGLAGSDPPDEWKSETVHPQTGEGLDESESQETNMCREHEYLEWECVECDMGFDEVAKLHLHYIKHATGELPMPQDDIEDNEG